MAFFTAFIRCITIGKGMSNSAIYRYMLNTNKVGIRLFRLAVSLKALNTIYKAISLLISDSLIIII